MLTPLNEITSRGRIMLQRVLDSLALKATNVQIYYLCENLFTMNVHVRMIQIFVYKVLATFFTRAHRC